MKKLKERNKVIFEELNRIEDFIKEKNLFLKENQSQTVFQNIKGKILKDKEYLERKEMEEKTADFFINYISFLGEVYIGNQSYISNENFSKSVISKFNNYEKEMNKSSGPVFALHNELKSFIVFLENQIEANKDKKEGVDKDYEHLNLDFEVLGENEEDSFYFFLVFLTAKQIGCTNRLLCISKINEKDSSYCLKSFSLIKEINRRLSDFILENNEKEIKEKAESFFSETNEFLDKELSSYKHPYVGNALWNYDYINNRIQENIERTKL